MRLFNLNKIKKAGIRVAITAAYAAVVKRIMGESGKAGYNPVVDKIGYIEFTLGIPTGFKEGERKLKKQAPDVWLHEDAHRRIMGLFNNAKWYIIARKHPAILILDEASAWVIAYLRARKLKIKMRHSIVVLAFSTYLLNTTWYVIDMVKWINKRKITS